MGKTLFDKIWDNHRVGQRADGRDLIYMDRHIVHDLHGPHAYEQLEKGGRGVRRPDLTFSALDHTVSTQPGRDDTTNPEGTAFLRAMREVSRKHGVKIFDLGDRDQGISHVIAPELGMVLPGATHAVPDSHACTVGGLGALAYGVGTTELTHILATQVLPLHRPKGMRVTLDGALKPHVTAKDVALRVLAEIGVEGGSGYVIEYAGPVIDAMPIEGRLTLCNLIIEMGSRTGLVAPDEKTFAWIKGRPWAPQGACGIGRWRNGAISSPTPMPFSTRKSASTAPISSRRSPGAPIRARSSAFRAACPIPAAAAAQRPALTKALDYMGLAPGAQLAGTPVNRVFIGSCTNTRMPDLEAAAENGRGPQGRRRRRRDGGAGLVTVKRQAEAAGLDKVFRDAGFFWGESGCSMCAGGNGDKGAPGERCVSTTNRNFEHRQGRDVRTHLVSPETAAATAIAGRIADVRA